MRIICFSIGLGGLIWREKLDKGEIFEFSIHFVFDLADIPYGNDCFKYLQQNILL